MDLVRDIRLKREFGTNVKKVQQYLIPKYLKSGAYDNNSVKDIKLNLQFFHHKKDLFKSYDIQLKCFGTSKFRDIFFDGINAYLTDHVKYEECRLSKNEELFDDGLNNKNKMMIRNNYRPMFKNRRNNRNVVNNFSIGIEQQTAQVQIDIHYRG